MPIDEDAIATRGDGPSARPPENATSRQDRLKAFLGALLAGFGGIAGAALANLLLVIALDLMGITLSLVPTFALSFAAGGVGFIGVAIGYQRYRGIDSVPYIGIRVPTLRDLLWVVGGYLGAMALVTASAIVLTQFQIDPDTTNRAAQAGIENPILLLWLIPLSFFVIAPAEELLFRGTIQKRLREAYPALVAIPVTAALFALLHFFSLTGGAGGRLIAISILFFPSLVFGTVYEYSDNIVVSILVHGAYNSTLVLLVYVSLQMPETAFEILL